MKIFEKFGKAFLQLDPKKRKLLIYLLMGFLIAIVAFSVYQSRMTEKEVKKQETTEAKFEEIVPEVKILQRSLYYETQKKTKKLEKKLLELEKQLQQQRQELGKKEEERKELEKELTKIRELLERNQQVSPKQPSEKVQKEQEQVSQIPAVPPPVVTEQIKKEEEEKPSWVGGIGEVVSEDISKVEKEKIIKEKKIQKEEVVRINEVYLPPSFVSADLLNGFAAFVASQGKQEPVRTFFRLRDLAVLPNEVKSDLRGCFVIGEAYGNLADERAHVRLLRLSCIARDGSSVIDAPVRGWVVDEDGKAGLKGYVVTKMGAFLTRSMLAGFIDGFGQAYAESFYNVDITSGNQMIRSTSPKDAAKIGFGKGLSQAGKGLSDFFMELARQTLPVIEVGAGKRVTIVFTEGVNLKIKKTCIKGRDGCIEEQKLNNLSVLTSYYGN